VAPRIMSFLGITSVPGTPLAITLSEPAVESSRPAGGHTAAVLDGSVAGSAHGSRAG
jgi:hypothetical protein